MCVREGEMEREQERSVDQLAWIQPVCSVPHFVLSLRITVWKASHLQGGVGHRTGIHTSVASDWSLVMSVKHTSVLSVSTLITWLR